MTTRHSPQQQYREAKPRNVYLGARGGVDGLRKLVESCATTTGKAA